MRTCSGEHTRNSVYPGRASGLPRIPKAFRVNQILIEMDSVCVPLNLPHGFSPCRIDLQKSGLLVFRQEVFDRFMCRKVAGYKRNSGGERAMNHLPPGPQPVLPKSLSLGPGVTYWT